MPERSDCALAVRAWRVLIDWRSKDWQEALESGSYSYSRVQSQFKKSQCRRIKKVERN